MIIQQNLKRSATAQDLLTQLARERGADVALLSDYHRVPANNSNWVFDPATRSAVVALGRYPIQRIINVAEGMVAVEVHGITFISCYAPPSWNLPRFKVLMEAIVAAAHGRQRVVVAGDFNAAAVEWGRRNTCRRGHEILALADLLSLRLLNRGRTPTFQGSGVAPAAVNDITLASRGLQGGEDWSVLQVGTTSDHWPLAYSIGAPAAPRQQHRTSANRPPPAGRRWDTSVFSAELFVEALRLLNFAEVAVDPATLVTTLQRACDETMPRLTGARNRTNVYWWTEEIAGLRTAVKRAQATLRRTRDPTLRSLRASTFRALKKSLRKAIGASKRRCNEELADSVEDNPWGDAYKIVQSWVKGARMPQERDPEILGNIVGELFPTHTPMEWPQHPESDAEDPVIRRITDEELLTIAAKLNPRKAPGPDAIPNGVVTAAIRESPATFRRIFQRLLDDGVFPDQWKSQRLVLLPKSGKPPGQASSFRPLCMLDTVGKVFERIVLDRLNDHLESPQPDGPRLSPRQYGFRKGRSTVEAIQEVVKAGRRAMSFGRTNKRDRRCCMVVALDVRNAFNSASWTGIGEALEAKGVPGPLLKLIGSYFRNRVLHYSTSNGQVSRPVTAGVPQGSILGPTLWNVLYDGVFDVELTPGAEAVGFADDLVLMVPGRTPREASALATRSVNAVRRWMSEHQLSLALQKTEMVMVSSLRQGHPKVPVRIGGSVLRSQRHIRYLGVQLEDHLSWNFHVRAVTEKATRINRALGFLLKNHGGPSSVRRRTLASVSTSILRYAAPVWWEATKLQCNRRRLNRVHNRSARMVASTFRTVKYEVATVVAGLVPIVELIREDHRCHERRQTTGSAPAQIRKEERATTMRLWQQQWDELAEDGARSSRFVRWCHRVIPDVDRWVGRKHGRVGFHLSQVLTGHGFFRQYLCSRKFTRSPACPSCPSEEESPEHVMFHCPRFAGIRERLLRGHGLQPVDADNMLDIMLHSPEAWTRVEQAANEITGELQRSWNVERAAAAAEEQEAARRRIAAREERRERWRMGRFGRDPTLRGRIQAMPPAAQAAHRRTARQLLDNIRRLRSRERTTPPEVYAANMALRVAALRHHDAAPERQAETAARLAQAQRGVEDARRRQRNERQRAWRRETRNAEQAQAHRGRGRRGGARQGAT